MRTTVRLTLSLALLSLNPSYTHAQVGMGKLNVQAGRCSIVEATREHIEQIYPFMRKADQIEVACMGHTPKEALENGFENDDVTLTALDPWGVPFAMFGVGQVNDLAYIWWLGTDSVTDHAYDFIKSSRKWTQMLTKPYGATFNFVHEENKLAIKWLKFCGAIFTRKLDFNNQPFFEFIITSK